MHGQYLSLLCLGLLAVSASLPRDGNYSFPDGFMFGACTAAYQIEGAWNVDGKGESILDRFYHTNPSVVVDRTNGDVADDSYHLYKEDVQLLKNVGFNFYRFSIAWTRIMPTGEANNINQAGIQYYNNLIDELIANGITPMVTMYHWDLPQWLQDLGGWVNPIIPDYFEDYARVLFQTYGDRVKWWITINEPLLSAQGYASSDIRAPGVNKPGVGDYLAIPNILMAHARAYHLYESEFRTTQQGKVSLVIGSSGNVPYTNSTEDIEAAERASQFEVGLCAHPIFSTEGDFPSVVRERVDNNSKAEGRTRSRLPVLSQEMVEYIRGTYDFFGLNYYTTAYLTSGESGENPSQTWDSGVTTVEEEWTGWGMRRAINWITENYNAPTIIITENGTPTTDDTLEDQPRIEFFKVYMSEMLKAIYEDGANVTAYIIWSLMDTFEWGSGYSDRYGIHAVNITDPARTRTPKASAEFFKNIISTRQIINS